MKAGTHWGHDAGLDIAIMQSAFPVNPRVSTGRSPARGGDAELTKSVNLVPHAQQLWQAAVLAIGDV